MAPDLRRAVLNTVGSIVCFRVSHRDASQLVREVFPSPDFLLTTRRQMRLAQVGPLPIPIIQTEQKPLGWDNLILELANLAPRYFWMRRRGPYGPALRRTLDFPKLIATTELQANLAAMIEEAGRCHGRLKSEARRLAHDAPSRSQAAEVRGVTRPDPPGFEDDLLREAKAP